MSYFLSFAVILSSLCNWKGAQSYKKLPEAIVPKVGHGPKMGQYGFDRACFSVVFLFLLFYSLLIWSQWGDGHGSIGLLQARFFCHAGHGWAFIADTDFRRFSRHKVGKGQRNTTYGTFSDCVGAELPLRKKATICETPTSNNIPDKSIISRITIFHIRKQPVILVATADLACSAY